jgi:hypothetical protein
VTIQEYRVQSIQASGSPVPVGRAAGSQTSLSLRLDPAMGYAVAVYAVDTSNRLSGPSNVVNTAGAATATPIPPEATPSSQAPYGYSGATVPYSGAPVPGVPGTQPYGGVSPAQPYNGAYPQPPYGGTYPPVPYGSAYPPVPYSGPYALPRPPVYGPAGWCPGILLIGGPCLPR